MVETIYRNLHCINAPNNTICKYCNGADVHNGKYHNGIFPHIPLELVWCSPVGHLGRCIIYRYLWVQCWVLQHGGTDRMLECCGGNQ